MRPDIHVKGAEVALFVHVGRLVLIRRLRPRAFYWLRCSFGDKMLLKSGAINRLS